jgi:hypothetical protein
MDHEWLCTLETSFRYQVGADMLKMWRRWKTFPEHAVKVHGRTLLWHIPTMDNWLKHRPLSRVGRPPRWASLVGNPHARELQVGQQHLLEQRK